MLKSFAQVAFESDHYDHTNTLVYTDGAAFFWSNGGLYKLDLYDTHGTQKANKVNLLGETIDFDIISLDASTLPISGDKPLQILATGHREMAIFSISEGRKTAHISIIRSKAVLMKGCWSSLSRDHILALYDDNSLKIYNILNTEERLEQTYNLSLEFEKAISFATVSNPTHALWSTFSVYILTNSGNVYCLTPVLPYDVTLDGRTTFLDLAENEEELEWVASVSAMSVGNFILSKRPDSFFITPKVQGPFKLGNISPGGTPLDIHVVGSSIPLVIIVTFQEGIAKLFVLSHLARPIWNVGQKESPSTLYLYDELDLSDCDHRWFEIQTDKQEPYCFYICSPSNILKVDIPWQRQLEEYNNKPLQGEIALQNTTINRVWHDLKKVIVGYFFSNDPLIDGNIKRFEMILNSNGNFKTETIHIEIDTKKASVSSPQSNTFDQFVSSSPPKIESELDLSKPIDDKLELYNETKVVRLMNEALPQLKKYLMQLNNSLSVVSDTTDKVKFYNNKMARARSVIDTYTNLNQRLNDYKEKILALIHKSDRLASLNDVLLPKYEYSVYQDTLSNFETFLDEVKPMMKSGSTDLDRSSMLYIEAITQKQVASLEDLVLRIKKLKNMI